MVLKTSIQRTFFDYHIGKDFLKMKFYFVHTIYNENLQMADCSLCCHFYSTICIKGIYSKNRMRKLYKGASIMIYVVALFIKMKNQI